MEMINKKNILKSVKEISANAFYYVKNLKTIHVSKNVKIDKNAIVPKNSIESNYGMYNEIYEEKIIARPLAMLFAISSTSYTLLIDVCEKEIRIVSLGYIFMRFIVAVQDVLQALRYVAKLLITALLRLIIFVFPIAYLFYQTDNVEIKFGGHL